jgi:2-polyprenyl-3-methyl-5-hydroxy-6-metoxy-1,4-benzoquinol methylase
MPPVFGDCDVVLLLDILEHLVDPWSALSKIVSQIPRNASVIVSLPNVRYWRVSLNLAFRGRWDLQDAGVLDRTHLRFFTRDTGADLIVQSGLSLQRIQNKLGGGRKRRLLNDLTFGMLRDFLSLQYLYRAIKA